jgi:hypothetical protein
MRKAKMPSLLTIAILTVITVIFWIGLDVYRALTQKPAPEVGPKILAPIDSSLDTQSLDKLEKRVYIDQFQAATASQPPTPKPSATPIAIPSPNPTP